MTETQASASSSSRIRTHVNMRAWLGVGGVPDSENRQARRFGQLMETAVLMALALVFFQLFMSMFGAGEARWVDTVIWSVFAVEFFGSLLLVQDRWRYVRYNWMNALIVFLAFPWLPWGDRYALLFQSLRMMLILRFLVHFFGTALEVLRRNRFGQVLGLAALLVVFAGATFSHLEHKSFSDGIWWALVTITTVGYGDVVPVTENGRLFGAFMILFGVVLFSLITANISAFLVGEEETQVEREILQRLDEANRRLIEQERRSHEQLEAILNALENQVRWLEAQQQKQSVLLQQLLEREMAHLSDRVDVIHESVGQISESVSSRSQQASEKAPSAQSPELPER